MASGIPHMGMNYYQLLGIEKDARAEDIKKAYRRLALRFHPDLNPDDATAESFKEITEAYGVLIDPEKRRTYDLRSGYTFNRETVFDDILSRRDFRDVFEDLPIRREWVEAILNVGKVIAFEALVVGGTPGAIIRRSMVRLAASGLERMFHKVMDMHEKVSIPASIAVTGGSITLEYRPGFIKRTIRVKIPPNMKKGMVLRVPGMGRPNLSKRTGDLYLQVDIAAS